MNIDSLFSVIEVPDAPEPVLVQVDLAQCPRVTKALQSIEDAKSVNTRHWKKEIWRNIEGYEGAYQVSSHGRVRSLPRTRIAKNGNQQTFSLKYLKPIKVTNTYAVQLDTMHQIHRLVATAFVENSSGYNNVIWKDGNRANNYYENLEWGCTRHIKAHSQEVKAGRKFQSNTGFHSTMSKRSRPIQQFTLNGDFVAEWGNGMELMRCLNIGRTAILKACDGQGFKAYGFLWKYKNTFLSELSKKDGDSGE